MSFSKEQTTILITNGWHQSSTSGAHIFFRGSEWVTISGNVVNWSGRCKTYNPSLKDFAEWTVNMPIYFDPDIKAKLNSSI
jgi:hypothetical protein